MHLFQRFECASLLALAGLAWAGCAGPDAAPTVGDEPALTVAARRERLVTVPMVNNFNAHDPFWIKRNGANSDAVFRSWFDPNFVSFSGGSMKLRVEDVTSGGPDSPAGVPSKPYTSAEYFSSDEFQYGTFEITMKGTSRQGIISSFFLYTDSPQHDEIDIEFVGNTPLQFNYFQNGVGGNEQDYVYPVGFDPVANFNTYAIVWTPTSITWRVNGVDVHSEIVALTNPMKVIMNTWVANPTVWAEPGFFFPLFAPSIRATYDTFTYTPLGPRGRASRLYRQAAARRGAREAVAAALSKAGPPSIMAGTTRPALPRRATRLVASFARFVRCAARARPGGRRGRRAPARRSRRPRRRPRARAGGWRRRRHDASTWVPRPCVGARQPRPRALARAQASPRGLGTRRCRGLEADPSQGRPADAVFRDARARLR